MTRFEFYLTSSRRLWASLCLSLMATVLLVSPSHAQTTHPADQMYTIAKKLNCPTCAGRNLADCPTDTCTQWKNEIIDQLNQGKTAEEIVGYFEARFGATVLQEPPKQGFTLWMWLIPIVALIGLGVTATMVIQRSSRGTIASAAPVSSTADPYVDEIEKQVRERA